MRLGPRREHGRRMPAIAHLEPNGRDDKVDDGESDGWKAIIVGPFVEEDNEDGGRVVHHHVQLDSMAADRRLLLHST